MYDELANRLRNAARWADKGLVITPSVCLEAADAIEELLQETQQLPRWIPVTERLPEERKDVLVALRRGEIAVDYYQPNRWGYSDVTHWMPLPQPPKEEKT